MITGATYPSGTSEPRFTFELLCLANGKKQSQRCVAGLRIDTGRWLRPVSAGVHGELTLDQRRLRRHGEPRVFDVIRVGCSRPLPTPGQPENWLIDHSCWELLHRPGGAALASVLRSALHTQPGLFGCSTPCVPAASLAANPARASLLLIRPQNPRWITVSTGMKRKARVCFDFCGTRYRFPLTDPIFEKRLKTLDDGEHASAEIGIRDESRLLFTLSLGEPYQGYCYKLVAAVLLPPATWPLIDT